mgnify:CR=1 FL=1
MGNSKINKLYTKPGERPVGDWFVRNNDASAWHFDDLTGAISVVKNGPGEEFYYEEWELIRDRAWRIDADGHKWTLEETHNALYELRDDFDRYSAESPL